MKMMARMAKTRMMGFFSPGKLMPEISRFFGIVIQMFWTDHAPPHFHAKYGSSRCAINLHTLAFWRPSPPRDGIDFGVGSRAP